MMDDRTLTEILAAHADHLNRGGDGADYLVMFADHRDQLAPLLTLAERVKRALVPMQASPLFRDRLRHDLATAALGRRDTPQPARPNHRLELVIGAAAIGVSVSLVGLVAYLRRSRGTRTVRAA
ncbi:MAG: hypothetical protein IT330_16090 [Anaerolineae bacterium]|nr:hypothetical protein [Anaerolineae bacterium]